MTAHSSPKVPEREAPTPHRFKVQMYDFACEGLEVQGNCQPYLQIDFDNFKVFRTDPEPNSASPEWGFKAGFLYIMNYLEKLRLRELRVQCFNWSSANTAAVIGEASIDLQTVACGPSAFKLTLRDERSGEPRGILKFTCVMKMVAPQLTVICRDLTLTMQGCPAPARLQIGSTLEDVDDANKVVNVPHSQEGVWALPCRFTFEASLCDLLKAQGPAAECLRFEVIDEMGVRQGEALLEFRKAFSTKPDTPNAFKVPVTYTCRVDGEEKPEPVGAVGELEGHVVYQNLPVYAQMPTGICVDGQVEGGCWLIENLPYPHCMTQPPPVWQGPADRYGLECFGADPQPHEDGESRFDDVDDQTFVEMLEQIDPPPPWEKRRERAGDRFGRLYFADPRSRRTTWKDPRFPPENWDQRIDPQTGKVYFQYHKTRQSTYVDPRGCPPGWDMRLSRNGDIYFAYLPAMQTTFVDPRGLPDHIDACLDDVGRMYFKNHEAKSTTWEDPRNAQQEVTLTKWRQAQWTRWWKEQVWREIEELAKQRAEQDELDEEEAADLAG